MLDDVLERKALVDPRRPIHAFAVLDDDVGHLVAGLPQILFFAEVLYLIFLSHFFGYVEEIEIGHRVGGFLGLDLAFVDVERPDAVFPCDDAHVVGDEAGDVYRLDVTLEGTVVVDIDGTFRHVSAGGRYLLGDARLEVVFLEGVLRGCAEGDGHQEEEQKGLFHGSMDCSGKITMILSNGQGRRGEGRSRRSVFQTPLAKNHATLCRPSRRFQPGGSRIRAAE